MGSRSSNGGTYNGTDLSGWEARLKAREEALQKREEAVAQAEGRLGVSGTNPLQWHSIHI